MNNEKKWILSISIAQHDASICLMYGSDIALYIQEERVCRFKHDGTIPLLSLNLIPNYTEEIDALLLCNIPESEHRKIILRHLYKLGISVDHIECGQYHHLYHAASGFYSSGFDEAFCMVIDGWGGAENFFYTIQNGIENYQGSEPQISCDETTSIFKTVYPGTFSLENKTVVYDPHRTDGLESVESLYRESLIKDNIDFEVSMKQFFESKGDHVEVLGHLDIGVMYGVVSTFIGFSELECGKTMGLSAYGVEDSDIPPIFFDKKLKANMNLFTQSRCINTINYPELENLTSFEKRSNFAYAIQKALEQKFIQKVKFIDENYSCKNVVISGGTGFNVVANSVLQEEFPHMNFFVDPLPNDSGQSLGHALLYYYTNNPEEKRSRVNNIYFGPNYGRIELRERILKSIGV